MDIKKGCEYILITYKKILHTELALMGCVAIEFITFVLTFKTHEIINTIALFTMIPTISILMLTHIIAMARIDDMGHTPTHDTP